MIPVGIYDHDRQPGKKREDHPSDHKQHETHRDFAQQPNSGVASVPGYLNKHREQQNESGDQEGGLQKTLGDELRLAGRQMNWSAPGPADERLTSGSYHSPQPANRNPDAEMNPGTNTPAQELSLKFVRFLLIGSTVVSVLIIAPIIWVVFTEPKVRLPNPLMWAWAISVIAVYMVIWLRYFTRTVKASRRQAMSNEFD